jgi:RHS repeat-associated protein
MRKRRHPKWIRRVSAGLIVPMLLLCTDFYRAAWAFRVEHARRSKLIDVAKKQRLDPEMLLDPVGYQKKEAERAKVRRAKAVKEAEELSKPDPVKLAAAEKERAQVRKAYAPVELASIAKDLEGLRTTLAQLHAAAGNHKRVETALNTLDGYARILSDAHEVLARYDATEREKLASLPPVIRARHDRFMREVKPLVKAVRDQLDDLVQTKSIRNLTAIGLVERRMNDLRPAPTRPVPKGFALHPAKFIATPPRHDPEEIRKVAPRVMTPAEFDRMNQLLRSPSGGGLRGIFKLPAFLIALLSGPGAGDLAATDEAPLSDDIVAKANALNHDPIAIYNFVHDHVVTEVYYGSKKGARGVLAEMAGNDFDQASLLVALLRASGFPARYELGTVDLTPDQAMAFTGTETPAAAASALVSSGFPARQLATGNTVTAIEMELAWVRAYVPYQNYRGIGVAPGGQGSVWAHLAPSIKRYQSTANATNLVGKIPFDLEAYLSREQPKSPVDTWEDQVRAYLQANPALNCTTLEGAQKNRVPIADQLPLLPETLPMQVAQRLAVFSDVPSAFKHTVEIIARTSGGAAEIDYSASIAALYGKPLAVQYDPATAADAATIAAHGGLDNTPAYLVQLRPVLYSADIAQATGPIGDTPGLNQSWRLHFNVPNLAPDDPPAHTFSVGGVYALVFDAGSLPGALVDAAAQLEQDVTTAGRPAEFIAAARLLTLGRRYFTSLDRGHDRVNGLYWSRYFKDTYEGAFGLIVRGQSVNGVPVSVRRNLVDIDVVRLTTTPFAIDGNNANSAVITRLIGHHSSFLEHSTPQAFYGANQWSAVRLLQNAAQSGQTIFHIDSSNVDSVLTRIAVPDAVASDIRDQVAKARTVRIHSMAVTPTNLPSLWGYIPEDPATGAGGYPINAVLNGGVGDAGSAPGGAGPCDFCAQGAAIAGSAVDIANGIYYFDERDLMLPARGFPVVFRRVYRSGNAGHITSLGPGWQHAYDERLEPTFNGVTYVDQDGLAWTFAALGGGQFVTPAGHHQRLTQASDGSFTMTFKEGTVHRFDAAGRLAAWIDTNGHRLDFTRDATGRLMSVGDTAVRPLLALSYGTNGQLARVEDIAGRAVAFDYDSGGRMVGYTNLLGARKTYAYDSENRLVSKTDFRGNLWSIAYDEQGRWRRTLDPAGGIRTANYDTQNRVTTFSDPLNHATIFRYDSRGARVSTTDALGNTTQYTFDTDFNKTLEVGPRGDTTVATFDSNGNPLTITDPAGNLTTHTYGPLSTLLSTTDALHATTTHDYDGQGNLLSTTDALGKISSYSYTDGMVASLTKPGNAVTQFGYDTSGNITSIRDAEGGLTQLGYDSAGHVTSLTDANNYSRTFEVDASGQITAHIDPEGRRTEFTYDDDGNQLNMKDPLGRTTSAAYDELSRPTVRTDAAANQWRTEYDAAGQVVATVDPRGARWARSRDALGRLAAKTDPLGNTTTFGYCAALPGRVPCRRVDPLGNVTTTEFDLLGRPTSVTDPLGRVIQAEYDALGHTTASVDATGARTTFRYDAAGRLEEMIDQLSASTAYIYDGRGNRTTIIDANGHQSTFTYDRANRLLSETTAIDTQTVFSYDAAGNRVSKLDGDGLLTQYVYDTNRRVTSVLYADNTSDHFVYDAAGQRIHEANVDISRTLTYDQLGRPKTVLDERLGKTVAYDYDPDGNRIRMSIVEDQRDTGYAWDLANRLISLTNPDGDLTRFTSDALGRRSIVQYPNGVRGTWSYDAAGQILGLSWTRSSGEVLERFSYAYDSRGNRASKAFADGVSETYHYDALSRLTSVTHSGGRSVSYEYDAVGNRNRMIDSATGTTTYQYNAFNQLLSATDTSGQTMYSYDGRGNRIAIQGPSGRDAFTFDARSFLRSVLRADGAALDFGYTAFGQRVSVTDAQGPHLTLLDGLHEAVTYDAGGAEATRLDWDPIYPDHLLAQDDHGTKAFALSDALGSTTALVDQAGTVRSTYAYDVFGGREVNSEQIVAATGFTGRPSVDQLHGDVYLRARYYNSPTGTFTSEDPVNPRMAALTGWPSLGQRLGLTRASSEDDGTNRYAYALNNPALRTDPSGECSLVGPEWDFNVSQIRHFGFAAGIAIGLFWLAFIVLSGPQGQRVADIQGMDLFVEAIDAALVATGIGVIFEQLNGLEGDWKADSLADAAGAFLGGAVAFLMVTGLGHPPNVARARALLAISAIGFMIAGILGFIIADAVK